MTLEEYILRVDALVSRLARQVEDLADTVKTRCDRCQDAAAVLGSSSASIAAGRLDLRMVMIKGSLNKVAALLPQPCAHREES
ncbi:hypothetical protein [Lysinibacter sp. HNR]|uniref:hypothetical protein n=1 Tax=Lysinibacter sp. HNR TaxID=3031408 RepID=UPI002435A258|nr:hypothetical protein [Lysinibacter sp. HNR]WGD38491.1 hypothetical protein FrondiHNR_06160 [Lysinibacter sp. HNR]